jgi:probable F420-dependent oxidoreductase
MRFGVVFSFQDPAGSPLGHEALYAAAIELVERAEALGYDWVNLTEHHATDDGYGPAALPVLAAMATRTERIRLSTGMLILTLQHPVRIAEEAAVVDLLSHGRLTLGVAVGYRPLEFELFGIEYRKRGRRFEEALEVLVRSWSGEPFSYEGETLRVPEIVVRPRPVQRPHPPLWIGGSADAALRRAARYDSPLCPGATDPIARIEDRTRRYREIRRTAGRSESFDIVLPRLAVVADTMEEARVIAHPAITEMFERYMAYGGPPELAYALRDWEVLDDLVIVGDEDYCAAQVERYQSLGVTDLLLQFALPTLDPAVARSSMERFVATPLASR